MPTERILTGYRPTGKLHIGHWFGNLQVMKETQAKNRPFYFVADWHALTSDWVDPSGITTFTEEMVLDWIAAGIDPEITTIYRQSDIPEVAELQLYLMMITPMSWLERVPTYKDQKEQIKDKDLGNVGFFAYPSLMTADIVIMLSDRVPVGEDQLPHLEIAREMVRRFNHIYGEYLVEPKASLTESGKKVLGIDGRKMSKSYGNAIFISDPPDEMRAKVMQFMTDPARKLKSDPGDPDVCPLQQLHKLIADDEEIERWDVCCRAAECGCVAHKRALADQLVDYFAEFRARRAEIGQIPGYAAQVLQAGAAKARPIAQETIRVVRELVGIDPRTGLTEDIEPSGDNGSEHESD